MTQASTPLTSIARAYRVRLRLKPQQARRLSRLFGAKRFVWNWALSRKEDAWHRDGTKLTGVDLSRELTELRKSEGTTWLASLPRDALNQSLRDFDTAWKNFFAGRARRPRRKRFGSVNAARFTLDQRRLSLVDPIYGSVQLDGVSRVRFRVTEPMDGRLRSVTVRRDSAGRWFATFTADEVDLPDVPQATREAVGIDMGTQDTIALSDGVVIPPPKHLVAKLARLRRYQRGYVRQRDAALKRMGLDPSKRIPKGTGITASGRMSRRQRQIGAIHARITDCKRDHEHQVTARIVASTNIIAIKDAPVKLLGRRSSRDGLGEIRRQLIYKAKWYGRTLRVVDPVYPSRTTCSACNGVAADLLRSGGHWTCGICVTQHDRAINAAINIEREALRLLAKPTGPDGRTRRSRGTNARGENASAVDKSASIGQPTSLNREPIYRAAPPRTRRPRQSGTALRREG